MRRTPRSRMQPSPMSRRPADASANISADLSAEVSRISERDSIVSAQSSLTVRVFGYPPDKAHAVVAYFQRLGNIAKRTMGSGNWLDIEYRDQDGFERARGWMGNKSTCTPWLVSKRCPVMSTRTTRAGDSSRLRAIAGNLSSVAASHIFQRAFGHRLTLGCGGTAPRQTPAVASQGPKRCARRSWSTSFSGRRVRNT